MAARNLEYDVLTVAQSKLEAVAVYVQYIQDAERHAERLRARLKRLVGQS